MVYNYLKFNKLAIKKPLKCIIYKCFTLPLNTIMYNFINVY